MKYKLEDIETLDPSKLSLAIDEGETVDYLWGLRARIFARDDLTDGQRTFYDIVIARRTNEMLFCADVRGTVAAANPFSKYQSEPR